MIYFIETFVYIISILGIILATYFLTIRPYYFRVDNKLRFKNNKKVIKNINNNGKKYINLIFKNMNNEEINNIINKINEENIKDMDINVKIYKIIDKK